MAADRICESLPRQSDYRLTIAVMSGCARAAQQKGLLGHALASCDSDALHIVALATDPMWQRLGIGGHLVAEAELLAQRLNLKRLVVSSTNDNLPTLYFYQHRGYRLTELVPESITAQAREENRVIG